MWIHDAMQREDKDKLREEIKIKRKEYFERKRLERKRLERKRRSELKKVVDNLNEECDAIEHK